MISVKQNIFIPILNYYEHIDDNNNSNNKKQLKRPNQAFIRTFILFSLSISLFLRFLLQKLKTIQ